MSYADSLLSTGERILHRERQHWLVLLWGARLPIVAIVLGIVLLLVGPQFNDPVKAALGWVAAALFIGGLLVLLWETLQYLNKEYVLTNRRVIEVRGVVNKRSTDGSLEKINDAILTQSIFGRIFGFGDLEVLTASEAGIERFPMIVNPIGFKKAMLDAKHEYEQDMSGSYRVPGPPIRESAPLVAEPLPTPEEDDVVAPHGVAAAPPEPSPAWAPAATSAATSIADAPAAPNPGPASAMRGDPAEVTKTLASLADLRDRGAISPEEYDSKKADLLGRL